MRLFVDFISFYFAFDIDTLYKYKNTLRADLVIPWKLTWSFTESFTYDGKTYLDLYYILIAAPKASQRLTGKMQGLRSKYVKKTPFCHVRFLFSRGSNSVCSMAC